MRLRYKAWLTKDAKALLKLQAFGITKIRAIALTKAGAPTLREALSIDCVTEGICSVYDWADTEWMEATSHDAVSKVSDSLFHQVKPWPPYYAECYRKDLRKHLVRRLLHTGNAFNVTAKLGEATISRENRRKHALQCGTAPVSVEDDATEKQLQRAIERRERLQFRRRAYVAGSRASIDT